jgi:hypothetical protein
LDGGVVLVRIRIISFRFDITYSLQAFEQAEHEKETIRAAMAMAMQGLNDEALSIHGLSLVLLWVRSAPGALRPRSHSHPTQSKNILEHSPSNSNSTFINQTAIPSHYCLLSTSSP